MVSPDELIALEEDWARAIVANDATKIAAFMADEWVIVSDAGTMSAELFLSVVRSGQLSHSAMARTGDDRVQIYGDTAVVTGRVTSAAHYNGQRSDSDEWTTDVFVRRDNRWVCVLTHITAAATA